MSFDYKEIERNLQENGYSVVENVLSQQDIDEYKMEFFKWFNSIDNMEEIHSFFHGNGILKFFEIGHQRFSWLARINKNIISIFQYLWKTDQLVVSFDGCCYYPSNYEGKEKYWTHTDQSPLKKGLHCIQSFVSLTDNKERSLVVYEKSHLLHEKYCEEYKLDSSNDWLILNKEYVKKLINQKKILNIKKGSLVLWDSRTFHQNTCGPELCDEERLVQYLCYLPKNNDLNDDLMKEQRLACFNQKLTTSHWPYPIRPVPKQPYWLESYFNTSEIINYDLLITPYLDDLMDEILKLIK